MSVAAFSISFLANGTDDLRRLLSTTTKGNLILSENLIGIVGMEPTFWIAVSLGKLVRTALPCLPSFLTALHIR